MRQTHKNFMLVNSLRASTRLISHQHTLTKPPSKDAEFKKLVRLIIRHIEVCYAEPEQKIIFQNDDNNGKLYVILNGVFNVLSLQFISKFKRQAKLLVDSSGEIYEKNYVRKLGTGDFFGEVALILNCRRSATVQSAEYGVYGSIPPEITSELLERFKLFKDMMWKETV